MDDMRNRYRAPRRDYSSPAYNRPADPPRPGPEPTVVPTRPMYAPAPAKQPELKPVHHQPEHESLIIGSVPEHRPSNGHHHQTPPSHHTHTTQPVHTGRVVRRPRIGLKMVVIIAVAALLIGVAGFMALPKNSTSKNPFSQSIKSSANFKLYYPAKLPDGYTIKSSSIQLKDGVLTYAATRADLRIVFTMQAVPDNFNFKAFYQQYLKNTQQFHTPYGQAVMGNIQNRVLSSMTDGKTWFILSDNSPNVSGGELRLIMDNLKQY